MNNSLDIFSKPLKSNKTKIYTIYSLNYRDSKKGRLFMPLYDERFPLNFKVKYSYISKFLEKGNTSGNHYHNIKEEILIPLYGKYEISLMDINTKESSTVLMDSEDKEAIYIPVCVTHKIKSLKNTGVLLVLASSPSNLDDEIEYNI